MGNRITLTSQDILNKQFKIDTRGYRMQEVDQYLDDVITNIDERDNLIKNMDRKLKNVMQENQQLKQEIRNLKSGIEAAKYGEKEITNVDLLRRVSQLEKIILGKEQE